MSNLTLIWNNKSDAAGLSGGSWEAALPVSNVQERILKKTARSSDLSLSSTQFTVDLLGSGSFYQSIAILSHNFSSVAKIRVRCSDDIGFTTADFDSGWVGVYQHSTPTIETDWENDNWWLGTPTAFDLQGYSLNTLVFTDFLIDSRYIRIEIDDSINSAGFVEIGRLMISPYTELLVNFNYGSQLAWSDSSLINESIGGTEYFYNRIKRREFTCNNSHMNNNEALSGIFEMQKNTGITEEIFVIADRDNAQHGFRTSFLARMTKLSGINRWQHQLNKTTFKFRELL